MRFDEFIQADHLGAPERKTFHHSSSSLVFLLLVRVSEGTERSGGEHERVRVGERSFDRVVMPAAMRRGRFQRAVNRRGAALHRLNL